MRISDWSSDVCSSDLLKIVSKSPADGAFPEPGTVPIGGPFTLVDHQGRTVTEQDFGNRYLLVFFGFSHCPDICPTTLADIAGTLDMLGGVADAVQPLFVSLDPERDTPERLAEYVAAFEIGRASCRERVCQYV